MLKLVTLYIHSLVMFLGFTNKNKNLPHSFLFCWRIDRTPAPISFGKWGWGR